MKSIRQLHLYLGCLCAPLILYFCLSGAWQLFGLHDIPKGEPGTTSQRILHAISAIHTHSTFPGRNPRESHSRLFDVAASLTAISMIVSALLGVVLAVRFAKRPGLVYLCLGLGFVLPFVLLAL